MTDRAGYAQAKTRLPVELQNKLMAAAEESHRSINAEIVVRLEASFSRIADGGTYSVEAVASLIEHLIDTEVKARLVAVASQIGVAK